MIAHRDYADDPSTSSGQAFGLSLQGAKRKNRRVPVIPANAGIQIPSYDEPTWIPAFAGMTYKNFYSFRSGFVKSDR
jgi:hypothetical protein